MSEEMSREMMPFHDHPLIVSETMPSGQKCDFCDRENITGDNTTYRCKECEMDVHKKCIEPVLSHPIQRNHFFKLYSNWIEEKVLHCHFCLYAIGMRAFAVCTISNIHIRMCVKCMNSPPSLTISQPKHHEHTFKLLMRRVTFICDACGVEDACIPYVCLECDMMVHTNCIKLPRVIMINRHDHRISHTFLLGQGEEGDQQWECGVCRKTVDGFYGAFKCSRCPNYAVHSRCATKKEVWDGLELEDVPEVEEIIEDPFKVINENGDIIHFSHKDHILRRLDVDSVFDLRCQGCVIPINGDPCYKCMECAFILHKACASLPRKKRHFLHNHKLILHVDNKDDFRCRACNNFSNGFRYVCFEECGDCVYDIRCSSASEPFHYDLHPQHPLFWTLEGSKECKACGEQIQNPLRCAVLVCDYALCMRCATLPRNVKSRYDDHFLRLNQGAGNASGELWCDICETKTDPSVRYYTCDECGVALHINCVLGDFYYMKEGLLIKNHSVDDNDSDDNDREYLTTWEVLPNNGATRPVCMICESRCKFPFFMKKSNTKSVIVCSIDCSLH